MEEMQISQLDNIINAISKAPWYNSVVISGIFIIYILYKTGILVRVVDFIFRRAAKKKLDLIDSENWFSPKMKAIHIMPREIAYTVKDMKIHMQKYSRHIERLRNEPCPAKDFIMVFEYTVKINKEVSKQLIAFVKEGMEKNVVTLIFGFTSNPTKSVKEFKEKCQKLEKKYKSSSFVVKVWKE